MQGRDAERCGGRVGPAALAERAARGQLGPGGRVGKEKGVQQAGASEGRVFSRGGRGCEGMQRGPELLGVQKVRA